MKNSRKEIGILILLVVLCLVTGTMNHQFFSLVNIQNTARLIGIYGVFSIGLGMVIITGGVDLSVGSMFALLGVCLSIFIVDWHIPAWAAAPLVIALASFLGFGHGLLITRMKLQPFIVTLCGLLLYRGLARFIVGDNTRGFSEAKGIEWLKSMSNGNLFGVPTPFVFLMVVGLGAFFLLHRSVFGRHLFAVGRNEEAAHYAGINTKRIVTLTYVFCSLVAGIAAIQLAFYTNTISPSSHGNFYELYGIAAAVIGGCSLRGGEGSITGILLGATLLQVLRNLVNLLGIPSSLDFAVMGIVILMGVIADQLLSRKRLAA